MPKVPKSPPLEGSISPELNFWVIKRDKKKKKKLQGFKKKVTRCYKMLTIQEANVTKC